MENRNAWKSSELVDSELHVVLSTLVEHMEVYPLNDWGRGKEGGQNKSLWVPKLVGPKIVNNIYIYIYNIIIIYIIIYYFIIILKGVIYTHLSQLSTFELWKLQAMALHWLVGWLVVKRSVNVTCILHNFPKDNSLSWHKCWLGNKQCWAGIALVSGIIWASVFIEHCKVLH